jgi:tRNA(Glu) U13 pseudouridine synthase TruD
LKLKKIEEDDFNKKRNKINLTFKLQKGSYATNLLRELMK